MNIIHIDDKKLLDDFVGSQKNSQFIQSWEWGEFQKNVSGNVWRIAVEDAGQLIASAKVIKKELPMGKSYFYCGRGPIFAGAVWHEQAAQLLYAEIERIAKDELVMFMRFDPYFDYHQDMERLAGNRPFFKTTDVQPSKTMILDIAGEPEEILKSMHQKTRYNIKLAEKKGIKVVEGGKERFEEFWSLLDQTTGRDNFRPHGRSYYQEMLDLPTDFLKLLFAEYRGKPIAASIVSFFGDTATYLHGGSANDERNVMAPYALQWQTILKAKECGLNYYDLHGVDEKKWPGVTKFKQGFGGALVEYPGTFDLVFDQGWYAIYKMVRQVRRSF